MLDSDHRLHLWKICCLKLLLVLITLTMCTEPSSTLFSAALSWTITLMTRLWIICKLTSKGKETHANVIACLVCPRNLWKLSARSRSYPWQGATGESARRAWYSIRCELRISTVPEWPTLLSGEMDTFNFWYSIMLIIIRTSDHLSSLAGKAVIASRTITCVQGYKSASTPGIHKSSESTYNSLNKSCQHKSTNIY